MLSGLLDLVIRACLSLVLHHCSKGPCHELQETSCHTVETIRVDEMCFRIFLYMKATGLWCL